MKKLDEMTCVSWGGYQYFKENIDNLKKTVELKYVLANKKYIDNSNGYIILDDKKEILKFKNPFVIISQAKTEDIKNAANWCKENDIPFTHLSFLVNEGKYKAQY